MDLDFSISHWDNKMNYLFDFFGFSQNDFGHKVLFNWGFAAKPNHPI